MTYSKLHLLNPHDSPFTGGHSFILCLGQFTHVRVWATNLGDALEIAADDYIETEAPGLLCTESCDEEYRELESQGIDSDTAWGMATADCTPVGSHGHYIASDDWTVVSEAPSRRTLKAYSETVLTKNARDYRDM